MTTQDYSVFHQKCCICCHPDATKDFTKQAITHLRINKTKTPSRQIYGNHHSQASVMKKHQANSRSSEGSAPQCSPIQGWLGELQARFLQQGWAPALCCPWAAPTGCSPLPPSSTAAPFADWPKKILFLGKTPELGLNLWWSGGGRAHQGEFVTGETGKAAAPVRTARPPESGHN